MKPSIGRIVHFRDFQGATRAAIITFVHSDTVVDLTVFYPKNDRPLYADADVSAIGFGEGFYAWSWPPRTP